MIDAGRSPVNVAPVDTVSWLIILLAVASAWLGTRAIRHYALSSSSLIDVPNSRSSHVVPTPRGGGIAIVAAFTTGCALLTATGRIPASWLPALLGGALPIAVVGFWDDRQPLPARWRFLSHLACAAWVLGWMGGIPPVPAFGRQWDLGWAGAVLAVLYLVWLVNLYNFMDGIDGIAGIEAITVSVCGAVCWWMATGSTSWSVPVLLAASVAGFLVWNWPPARIFMGDAGSGFIGMALGFLSLWTATEQAQVFWCWLILLGCFMVDATTTLVRRVLKGERFYEAHRSHAYQYASRRHASHKKVTLAVGMINVGWLFPWALAVASQRIDGALATLLAYLPLLGLALRYKAGDRAAQAV